MAQHALQERIELAESLRGTDPSAPTLCGRWTAAQLAGHLVLRERSASEVLGRVPSRRAHQAAQHVIDRYVARTPYSAVVDAVASGPPFWSPFSVPLVRESMNLLEYVVHHEDVRRAADGWVPRLLPAPRQAAVWSRLRMAARLTLRRLPVAVTLEWPAHGSVSVGRGAAVTVTGAPEELALFAFGRQQVARVSYDGPEEAVEQARGASIPV